MQPPPAPGQPEWWQDAGGNWRYSVRPEAGGGAAVAVPVPAQYPAAAAPRPCPECGRDWGLGVACQFCRQVAGFPSGIALATAGRRLSGYLLDVVLGLATLVVGWLIWSLIIYDRGQTPGKQLLGMRVVKINSGSRASWGAMFVREWLAKAVVGLAVTFTCGLGIVLYFWLLWDRDKQQLWDKIVETLVVEDQRNQL